MSICNRIGMRSTTMAALIATIIIIVAEKKKAGGSKDKQNQESCDVLHVATCR
jgi:hypothetical protein